MVDSEKKYVVVADGKTYRFNEQDWSANRDEFMKDFPQAEIAEVDAYKAEDLDDNDSIFINAGGKNYTFSGKDWKTNESEFMKDFPTAQIARVRGVDYYYDQANTIDEQLKAKDEEIKAWQDSRTDRTGADWSSVMLQQSGLSPVGAGFDPERDAALATYAAEGTRLQQERDELQKQFDSNPRVIEAKERAELMQKEYHDNLVKQVDDTLASYSKDKDVVDTKMREIDSKMAALDGQYGSISSQVGPSGETAEKVREFDKMGAAKEMLDHARDIREGKAKGFLKGGAHFFEKEIEGIMYQTESDTMVQIAMILKNLNDKVGNLNENLTPEVIDENLSKDDALLLRSYFDLMSAEKTKGKGWGFKAGEIAAAAIPFALEFAAIGGFADDVAKGATKGLQLGLERWVAKGIEQGGKAVGRKVAKYGAEMLTTGLLKAGIMTAMRPSTYSTIAQHLPTIDDEGNVKLGKNALIGTLDATAETISELSGGVIEDILGLGLKWGKGLTAKMFGESVKNIKFPEWGKALTNGVFGDYLKQAGFHGLPIEMLEEVVGNAGRMLYGDDSIKTMFEDGNGRAMLLGFVPMSLFGGAMSVGAFREVDERAARLGDKLNGLLLDKGFTANRANALTERRTDKSPLELSIQMNELREELKKKGATQEELDMVDAYAIAVAEFQTMRGVTEIKEKQDLDEVKADLTNQYGTFSHNGNVTTAKTTDGKSVFIVSDKSATGEYAAVDMQTGQHITISDADIATQNNAQGQPVQALSSKPENQYLSDKLKEKNELKEAERILQERNEQIGKIRELMPEQLNLGTEGEPNMVVVKSQDAKGVTVVDTNGNEAKMSWDAVGRVMGMPIHTFTDMELAEMEAQEIALKREALKAAKAKTYAENNNVTEELEQIKEKLNEITPKPEAEYTNEETGEVDEVSFWENDPEGYCKWNDKQNKDGGVDSIEQLENSIASLSSQFDAATKASKTDNPMSRKTANREAKRLAERIQRLQAIQNGYLEKFTEQVMSAFDSAEERAETLIAMRERINEWREKFGLGESKLVVYESLDEVEREEWKKQIMSGETPGWQSGKKAYIYLPHVKDMQMLDKTVMHEVVTHFGLRTLLGEKDYNALMDKVWNMMSDSARRTMSFYPGVMNKEGDERRRAAAEEFVAMVGEYIVMDTASAEQKSIWKRISDSIAEKFDNMQTKLNGVDVAGIVKDNYTRLEAKAKEEAQNAREAETEAKVEEAAETPAPVETVTGIVDVAQTEKPAIDVAPNDDTDYSTKTESYLVQQIRGYAKSKEGKKAGWTDKKIEDIIAETSALITAIHNCSTGNEFYDEFAAKDPTFRLDWRDGQLKPIVTWTRANIEYKYDMSADLLCVNNEGLEEVLSSDKMVALMELFNMSKKDKITIKDMKGKEKNQKVEIGFSQDDYLELYNTLKDLGFVVPCKGCFDAAGRFKMLPSVAYKFAAAVNAVIDERNADPEAFDAALKKKAGKTTTIDGLPTSAKTKLDAIRAGVAGDNLTEHVKWTQLMSADGQTKMLSDWGGIFRAWQRTGAGRPKDKLLPEPYYGDIVSSHTTIIGAYGDKTPSFRDIDVNQGTGLRRNSHSEFRPVLAVDEIQFMRDAFIKNLTVFKYMKELDDVRLFGKLGVKFNMSFFPEYVPGTKAAGLDAEGNYVPSEESVGAREFPYEGADGKIHYDGMKGWQEAQKHINKDVSLSSVILSIPHLIKAMTDVPTTFDKSGIWGSLIPFHSSGATSLALFLQGLGKARANGVGHGFEEAFTRYDEGVTNFEAVQNDRFGKGWVIVEGKKAGEAVEEGHKLEFVNGTHYYNSEMGLHLFASTYVSDSELPEGAMNEDGTLNLSAAEIKKIGHAYEIDYNNKVREIGTPTAYAEAADYYLQFLPTIGLKPRFDFDVPEETFLQMCEDANVDPMHPKLGWKGAGNAWNPIHSAAYYSLFCDYGMTDPATGEWAPHNPVGYVNENGEREFRMPENTVEIVKEGLDRYSNIRRSESAKIDEAINEFARRSVEKGRISQEAVDSVLGKENTMFKTENIGDTEVTNLVLDSSKMDLPKTRDEAIAAIPKSGKICKAADGEEIRVSRRSVRHSVLHNNKNSYALFGVIDDVVANSVKIGEIPIAEDEIGKTNSVSVYYVPVNINGTQYSARIIVKETIHNEKILDTLSLYNVALHTEKTPSNTNVGESEETRVYSDSVKSAYKVKEIIHNSQAEDKKLVGIENETTFFKTAPRTDEQRAALFNAAKEEFGVTNNFGVAGYMLPDGTLLDFSEVKDGGPANVRTRDHREIGGIMEDREYDTRTEYITDFLNEGAIRIMPESDAINLSVAPSEEQRKKLLDYFYKKDGYIILELDNPEGKSVAYVEYDKKTSPYRIMRDIDGYFNEGIVPQSNTMFKTANNNQAIFVSNAAKAVEGIKMEKATPEQWLKMIEKNGGLKAGEDKWMGLSDWLKASDKKTLTKDEVLDFINENAIKIEEQHYGKLTQETDELTPEVVNELQRRFDSDKAYYRREFTKPSDEEIEDMAYENLVQQLKYQFHNAPFGITDGRIYLDIEDEDAFAELARRLNVQNSKAFKAMRPINETRLDYTTTGLKNLHEIALTVPTIEPWGEEDTTHFGDAGDGRAVAWVRFGETEIIEEGSLQEYEPKNDVEREIKAYIEMGMNKWGYPFEECVGYAYNQITDVPSEAVGWTEEAVSAVAKGMRGSARIHKVLVIDEIQSKRHQEGRERGYLDPAVDTGKIEENYDLIEEKSSEFYRYLFEKYGEGYSDELLSAEDRTAKEKIDNEFKAAADEYAKYFSPEMEAQMLVPPYAPFDKNWHELAMKRMLRYAAENGYDYIAWTKGEQQAERYGITKVVKDIYVASSNVERYVSIKTKSGDAIEVPTEPNSDVIVSGDYKGQRLSDVVGKELADKIISVPEGTDDYISGDDLKVGGEGMKGFYDRMLPAFMNKYGKKWGVKVEDITLPNVEEAGRVMHSVPVTEEMRESVMEGQTMFSTRRSDQSAMSFAQQSMRDYVRKYGNVTYIEVMPVNDDTARELGYTLEELELMAGVYRGKKGIAIFAREKNTDSDQIETTIYHESVHHLHNIYPELDELAEYLWDNADDIGVLGKIKKNILAKIKGDEDNKKIEMLAFSMEYYAGRGEIDDLIGMVPDEEARKLIEFITNKTKYGRSETVREDSERGEAGRDTDGQTREQGEGSGNAEGENGEGTLFKTAITPEVRKEMDTISAQAIVDGNYLKAPNGKDTKLTPEQWALVRTKNFINWFGEWINDPENASKVVDPETGEPMVVYHGSPYGSITTFDRKGRTQSGLKEFGTYFTTNKKLAELYAYARQQAKKDIEAYEAEKEKLDAIIFNPDTPARIALDAFDELDKLNESQKPRVYEVFLNIRQPKVFDAEGKDGWNGWHKLKQDVGYDIKYGTEAIEAIAGHNKAARMDQSYDGIIAKNIADIHSEEVAGYLGDVFLVFDENPNQIKSATENNGEYSEDEDTRFKSYGTHNKYGQKDDYTQEFLDDIYMRVLSKYHFGKDSSPYVYMDGYLMRLDVPDTEHLKYYRNVDKTDGFGVRFGIFVGDITEEEFNEIIEDYERTTPRDQEASGELLETYIRDRRSKLPSDIVPSENIGSDVSDDGLSSQTQKRAAERGVFASGSKGYLRASEIDADISPISRISLLPKPRITAKQNAEYLKAVEKGDTNRAENIVEDVAEQMGYTEKVFHGTPSFGFTRFESRRPSGAIFTTSARNTAANYGGDGKYASVRSINKGIKEAKTTQDVLDNAKSRFDQNWRIATAQEREAVITRVEDEAKKVVQKMQDLNTDFSNMPFELQEALSWMENIIYDAADGRENGNEGDALSNMLKEGYKRFRESREFARQYIQEHYNELTQEQARYWSYINGFEVGDVAIDAGYPMAQAVSESEVATVDGRSFLSIDELNENTQEDKNVGTYKLFGNLGSNPLVIDAGKKVWFDLDYNGMKTTDSIAEWAKANGYTSVIFKNIYDYGDLSDVKVFFEPSQVKSADAITYDNKGNIIPLSKRFNEQDEDIRFKTTSNTSTMDIDELVEQGKQKVIAENKDAIDVFMDRIRAINGNLQQLRMAAAAQREYDQRTVKTITDIANDLLEGGALNDLTRGEIKRLLSIVNGGVGKNDLTKSVDRLMDLMVANQLRYGKSLIDKFLKIRGSKVDQRGVEVRGTLDIPGQQMLAAFKEGIGLSKEALANRIANAEDALDSESETKKRNAENELVGLYLAKQYHEDINESIEEEKNLRDEIRKADEDYKAGIITKEMHRQLLDTIYEAILENRIQRVSAYEKLASDLGAKLVSSIKNAGLLRDAEKERVQRIQHYANSDMQGMPASMHEVKERRFWNNPLVRFLLKPLATFDQMLRAFAPKSTSGEGYLWNHFMGGWLKATENEYKGVQKAHETLDEAARTMFGEGVQRWSDLFEKERKMPKITISVWDDGKMVEMEISQGNALYIYMVNKMTDGKMKLRRMGISQEDVDAIVAQMDPRFITLADWMQEQFLPSIRDKYNAVHERLFGAPMASIDNYFPIKVNARARTRDVDVEAGEGTAKPATITGSIIKRTRNSLALDINADAFDVMLEHIQQMEHWAAFAEFNKDLNTLLSYRKFRNRVENMSGIYGSGKTAWDNFKTVAEIAAGVYQPAAKNDSLDKWAINIAKGVTAAKINGRVYTAIKQLLSMPAFISDANIATLAKSMATPWVAWNWAMENLPMFEKRWKSRQAGDTRLMATESDWKFWKSKIVEIASRYGMTPNAFVDAVTVSIGAKSIYDTKYKEYLKMGYSEEQADKKAKRDATVLFNESQQSNESAFLSAVQVDRTVASVMFTVFRNSAMGYQRMVVDAWRNISHMLRKGYKEESVEFMKKQMVRDGLTEAQADRAAQRIYSRSFVKNVGRIAVFQFVVQFAWNLGAYIMYLLFGDDDEEKIAMIKDAAIRGLVGGPVEGLAGGSIVSNILGNVALGEKLSEVNTTLLPVASDLQKVRKMLDYDNVAAYNEMFNILVQSGIGVNPQTLTDIMVAIDDACNGDPETSKEVALCIMRILQVPQSQIEKLYFDEIDFTADKGLDLTIEQFAKRYADYKVKRGTPLTGWMYDSEEEKEREDKYIKRFLKTAEELKRSRGNEEAKKYYEYLDTDYKEVTETISELKRNAEAAAMKGDQMGAMEYASMLNDFMKTDIFKEYAKFGGKAKAIEAIRDKMKKVDMQTREALENMMLQLRKEMVEEMEKATAEADAND